KSGASGMKDVAGNALAADFSWSFCTIDTVAPTVVQVTPANGERRGTRLNSGDVAFSYAVDRAKVTNSTLVVVKQGTTTPIAGTVGYVSASNEPYSQPPRATLFPYTTLFRFKSGASGMKDVAGNALAADFSWSFCTIDTVAPTVVQVTPAN